MECSQKDCTNKALYRYTWPGQNESGICEFHKPKLENIANAMGLPLQIIPLTVNELTEEPK